MKVHHISTERNTTLHADKAGHTWIVDKTGAVITPNTGIDAGGSGTDRTIVVRGEVYGLNYGIEFGAMDGSGGGTIEIGGSGLVHSEGTAILSRGNRQVIGNDGEISGTDGILSLGRKTVITNNNTIDTSNAGINVDGGSATIYNNGSISGEAGIYSSNVTDSRVVVFNTGTISSSKTSVQIYTDGDHQLYNSGQIDSGVAFGAGDSVLKNIGAGKIGGFVDLGEGNDRLVNTGKITGEVGLGEGNDIADLRGGVVSGQVNGYYGNDTYFVASQDNGIYEHIGEGKDTIKSAGSYNMSAGGNGEIENLVALDHANIKLRGNSLDNRLVGNDGNNRLHGDTGDDLLIGGGGKDIFVFGDHYHHDTVKDFRDGTDRIDVSDWNGIVKFADIKAIISAVGDDVVISTGSDELILRNTDMSEIDKTDFIF